MNHQSQNRQSELFDVVALVGSAGAHAAIATLLRDLPADFAVPLILMQHLGPDSEGTLNMYARAVPFAVEWVTSSSALTPQTVLLCPPRSFVEVLPDGTFVLAPCERGAFDKPMDRLLESIARSFGHRAIGVVLSGMGADGVLGARALHLASGRVLVQSEASAEYAEMPKAAIGAGSADLVVPLANLGQVIGEIVAGTPRPRARSELGAIRRAFGEQGEVAARAREIDWAETPLGPAISWPAELRQIARTTLESASAMAVWWGPELIQIYNDTWCDFLGVRKHPQALGTPARESWAEVWERIGPRVERVLTHGEAAAGENERLLIDRSGYLEEMFITFSYSPLRDAAGAVVGVHATGWETTTHVVAERRMRALRELAAGVAGADTPREACERAARALAADPADVPFALLYLLDEGRRQASLAGAAGVAVGSAAAPYVLSATDDDAAWPLARVLAEAAAPHSGVLLSDLAERFPDLSPPPTTPAGSLPPLRAFVLPLRPVAEQPPLGVLIAALNPHRPFDDDARSFLDLIVQQINASLVEARARQLERERLERLADLDRAKTEFFANISHEFRTPLTLLLAPLEDLLRHREQLPAALADELEVAASNSRRLLRLVNSLLDFSQIETRRQHPNYEPIDLCALTTDIASAFRSAIEAAGLRFRVECDPNLQPVWIDRDMWEKVVSNLLSNAFKFTFAGEIALELHALSLHAELVVKDTGIGIPAEEMPNLFKRFHRVRGVRARTVEGSGIGLSIVDDLVKRLGGQLRARSTELRGTEFTIWIPYKSARITAEARTEVDSPRTHAFAGQLAEEASRWLIDANDIPTEVMDDLLGPPRTDGAVRHGTILVADDNADMRQYLQRLLASRWDVELTADGDAALQAAARSRPDIILADVMMPGLDGFQLMERVRADQQLTHTPVVLLTARAGEEAAIQGLLAGAGDYIAKPFSPRELVARLQAVFERARSQRVLRESEERQAFLLKLSDALRPLSDAQEIKRTATRILAEQLHVNRAFYADADRDNWLVSKGYEAGIESLPDRPFPMATYGSWIIEDFHAGRRLVVCEMATDARFEPSERDAHLALQIAAEVAVPLVKQGVLVAMLVVHSITPRNWTEQDLALIEETAERTWAAVERARAEEALQKSEEKYRKLFETMDQGYALCEMIRDANGQVIDIRYIDLNPAFERLTGATIAQAQGKTGQDVYSGLESFWLETYGSVIQQNQPKYVENKFEPTNRWYGVFVYPAQGDRIIALYEDITERKRAEETLRESEERQSFLLKLGDALRPLTDPVAIQETACRILGQHLHSDWSQYSPVDLGRNVIVNNRDYFRGDAPSNVGEYDLAVFPVHARAWKEGRSMVIPHVEIDPLLSDGERAGLMAAGVRAALSTPLVKDGVLTVVMSALSTTPRPWSEADVTLLEETAERTWAAVERGRAEAALRESEERQAFLLKLSDALRLLTGRQEIQEAATSLIGERLDTVRCYFMEIDDEHHLATMRAEALRADIPSAIGVYDLALYEEVLEKLRGGKPLVIGNWDERKKAEMKLGSEAESSMKPRQIIAQISAPIMRGGRLVGTLTVGDNRPRNWSKSDLVLVVESAERTWLAMANAEAEEALRISEEKYRTLFTSMGQGYCELELIHDESQRAVDHRYLEFNSAFERLFGIPVAAAKGRKASEVFPGLEQSWNGVFDRVARTGTPERFEYKVAALGRWFDAYVYPGGGDRVSVLYEDTTERKEREERHAFLLKLSDALRSETDAVDIQRIAARMLAEQLRAPRANFAQVQRVHDIDHFAVHGTYAAPGLDKVEGLFPIAAFPGAMDMLPSGQTMVVPDVAASEVLKPEDKATYATLGIASFLTALLVKRGKLAAVFAVHDTQSRQWASSEVTLLEEVAERTWSAVERAHAEEALRLSEENYRTLFTSIEDGFAICELVRNETEDVIDYRFIDVNPAFEHRFHLKRSEVIGRLRNDVLPPDENALTLYAGAVASNKQLRTEFFSRPLNEWYELRVIPRGGEKFVVSFNTITERKQWEQKQQFLLKLSDALRPLSDAQSIKDTTTRLLVDYLGATQSSYAEVQEDYGIVQNESAKEPRASVAGTYQIAHFSGGMAILRSGRDLVIPDVLDFSEISDQERAHWAALNVRANISLPLIKAGKLVATISVRQMAPRSWTPEEVELVRETGERTWAAVERARAEAALRESEGQLRALIENLPRGAAFIVNHDLRYILAEGEGLRLAGSSPNDYLGKTLFEVLDADQLEAHERNYRRALNGEPFVHEHDVNGHTFVSRGVPLRGANGNIYAVLAVSYDITDRKRAEEAGRESKERLRSLFDTMSQGVAIMKLVRNEAGDVVDAQYLEFNPAFETLTGLDRSAATGLLASELFPQHFLGWQPRLATVKGMAGAERFESYIPETGRWYSFYAALFGEPDGFVVFFDDITGRKEAETRQAFLLKLSDALRLLSDPLDIQRAAMQLVGEHLQVDRALYNEIRDDGQTIDIDDNYVRGDVPKVTGDFAVRAFGAAMDVLRRGEILVIEDQRTTPLKTPLESEASTALGVYASATVPLIKAGRWVANFGVLHGSPRAWTANDIAILQETAERTWAAVERARAEKAQRESQAQLAAVVDILPVGIALLGLDGKIMLSNREMQRYLPTGIMPSRDQARVGRWRAWHADGRPVDPEDFPGARAARGERVVPGLEVLYTQDDGTDMWTQVAAVPILDSGERMTGEVVSINDITVVKQAQAALRESEAILASQSKALELALNQAPLEQSLGVLVEAAIGHQGEGTRAAFYLVEADSKQLRHVVGMPAAYTAAVDGFQVGPESLVCGRAVHTGQPVLSSDVHNDPLWEPWVWLAERFEYRGCWIFPIQSSAGTFVGTLAIYSQQPREATQPELDFAAHLTQIAAIIIARHGES